MKTTTRIVPSAKGDITIVRLENSKGEAVELSSLGAGILSVEVWDRDGKLENVALGYADPADYIADGPCMGKIPGRYANRIAKGHLDIDGREYQLEVNNGPNHLHGGSYGFQNRIWDVELIPGGVRFILISPAGDANYPGELAAEVIYGWNDDSELTIDLQAETDDPTVVNLTNHAYWNLRGADSGSALDHTLRLNAGRYLPTDETLIPLADAPATVEGTPMDFREPKRIGRDLHDDFPALNYGKGYDACWVIDNYENGELKEAAVLKDDHTGRTLTVLTDQPGVQVYSGNWLAGSPKNRSGREYADYDGIAIEAQGWPDAPNRPDFPSQELIPGDLYRRRIVFKFSAD